MILKSFLASTLCMTWGYEGMAKEEAKHLRIHTLVITVHLVTALINSTKVLIG